MHMKPIRAFLLAAGCCAALPHAAADSLYKPQTFQALTADHKALRVGDLLTVQVFENATATTSADTATRRKNSASLNLANGNGHSLRGELQESGDFDGGGHTQRTNRFLTSLTVTVRAVLPNGDLMVEGRELLTLNDERQTVQVEGRVRRVDISDANVVLSTRLGDARITLVGDGDLSERQRRAWWRRAIDWMGL